MVNYVDCAFVFQAEDGIRDLVRSRGLGDVYKRQDERDGVDAVATVLVAAVDDPAAALATEGEDVRALSLIHI